MLDKTWQLFDQLMESMRVEMNEVFRRKPRMKRHRIVTKDGHITITGEFKSLTVNGRRFSEEELKQWQKPQ